MRQLKGVESMSSEVKQVTFFAKEPRCPKCNGLTGDIVNVEHSLFEFEEQKGIEESFILQDVTIVCNCGETYKAKYLSLPIANMDVQVMSKSKEE